MSSRGSVAAGLVMVIAGIWLLLQTLVAGLPARIVGLGTSSSSNGAAGPGTGNPAASPGTSASSNPTPAAAAAAKKAGIPTGSANTTNPKKPIFIAPSGQPISGYVTP